MRTPKRLKAKINSTISQEHSNWLINQATSREVSQAQILEEALELMQKGLLYQADTGIVFQTTKGKVAGVSEVHPEMELAA